MKQDELVGFWENDLYDGSGLHALWGYGIEFSEDGNGFNINWGHDIKPEDRKQPIHWKRKGAKIIAIKLEGEEDWDEVEYEISEFIGVYDKLIEKGKNEFWIAPEPLYKRKE